MTTITYHKIRLQNRRQWRHREICKNLRFLPTPVFGVPIRCQDVTVYFSMEEWEYLEGHKDLYKDVMMEVPKPLTSPVLSSKRTTPERCPRPLLPQDYKQEDPDVSQDHQVPTILDPLSGDLLYKRILLIDPSRMDMDRDKMAERILHLTLEILFRLTGEDYTVVKKTSSERCQAPVSEGWGRPLSPITGHPPHPPIHEDINDQKILELTYKMIELLTGEVPIRCQDVTVYFSMEEWEYLEGHKELYKDVMMAVPQPLTSPVLSSKRTTPERCPRPLLPQDCKQEDPDVPQDVFPPALSTDDCIGSSDGNLSSSEFKTEDQSITHDTYEEHAVAPNIPPVLPLKASSSDLFKQVQNSDLSQNSDEERDFWIEISRWKNWRKHLARHKTKKLREWMACLDHLQLRRHLHLLHHLLVQHLMRIPYLHRLHHLLVQHQLRLPHLHLLHHLLLGHPLLLQTHHLLQPHHFNQPHHHLIPCLLIIHCLPMPFPPHQLPQDLVGPSAPRRMKVMNHKTKSPHYRT
ncbi:uncharacterized protein LOC142259205 [Anomaloglossus baeobatrachus]|uniref:uncharacterized protein LOC142259205 n=1 Tax=Anomaloglossus baeobatrachus TaxID=238106 RepID=UPI003F4FD324